MTLLEKSERTLEYLLDKVLNGEDVNADILHTVSHVWSEACYHTEELPTVVEEPAPAVPMCDAAVAVATKEVIAEAKAAEEPVAEEPKAEEVTMTYDEVRKICAEAMARGVKIQPIIKKYVTGEKAKLTEVDPSRYAELVSEVKNA